MKARILSIGDELILGRTVDTNATWISRQLGDRGLAVDGVRQVGDGEDAIVDAMRWGLEADLVVCSGGLGPTDDDRTRHALARVLGKPLEERAAAWKHVVAWYDKHRHGIAVPESNRRQILFPRGARLLANDRGTAAGMLARHGKAWIACVPGVPHEMRAMVERLPLARLFPRLRPPMVGELWFAGLGESAAQERLGGLLTEADPMVGITVNELGHITLRAVGTPAQVRPRMRQLARAIAPWRLPERGLAPSLIARCAQRAWTVAAAESCSGGHLAAQLTAVPGCSRVLGASFITYAPEAKTRLLGVAPGLIEEHGVVSEAVAKAMAYGARRAGIADLGLATTGIAGPDGGTAQLPVGSVWVAASLGDRTEARLVRIGGERTRVQARAASEALLMGWEMVKG
jgi:nicotinamide-nucleotide amidase